MNEIRHTIGFIGTGIMGGRMARRLIAAGHRLAVWNRTPGKADALVDLGARPAASASDAGREADLVITMLADGEAVTEILVGQGLAQSLKPGAVLIDMSSIPPWVAREHHAMLDARGVRHLDAPVSGGPVGAEQGTLAIMAGGDGETFASALPVLRHLGRPTLVGPAGSGQLAKLCNQIIVALTIGAVSEALLLAHEGGADPAKVCQALKGGFADSLILQQHGGRMLERRFAAGGPCRLQLKDLRTILAAAGKCGLELPLSAHVTELYQSLVDRGGGDFDHSALLLEIERLNAPRRLGAMPDSFSA